MTEDQGASRDGARVYGARRAEGFSREEVGDFSARLLDGEGSAGPEHHSSATGRPGRRSRLGQAPRRTTRTSCTAGRRRAGEAARGTGEELAPEMEVELGRRGSSTALERAGEIRERAMGD
uniref:Uncharacterized protein n=1 Tax=Zea mays TaxID=4577 RepID=A0A804UK10_MAIZE